MGWKPLIPLVLLLLQVVKTVSHECPPVTLTCGLQCCGRHLNGFADRPPVRPNMSLGDTLAGLHAAFGVVMALLHRQRHGNKVPGQVRPVPVLL